MYSTKRAKMSGFTLLELLIAIVIVSVGVLGIASLQLVTTASHFEAGQRLQATLLANAVIDRLRTNSERLDIYASTDLGGGSINSEPSVCTEAMTEDDCLTATANHDRWQLEQLADSDDNLVSPRICITHNTGNVSVVVAWHGMANDQTTVNPNACGADVIDATNLRQVVMNTYVTPANPY